MKHIFVILFFILSGFGCFSQSFPTGTNAIHKDSSIIVSWAVSAVVERGYINIADTSFTYTEGGITSNKAWFGSPVITSYSIHYTKLYESDLLL